MFASLPSMVDGPAVQAHTAEATRAIGECLCDVCAVTLLSDGLCWHLQSCLRLPSARASAPTPPVCHATPAKRPCKESVSSLCNHELCASCNQMPRRGAGAIGMRVSAASGNGTAADGNGAAVLQSRPPRPPYIPNRRATALHDGMVFWALQAAAPPVLVLLSLLVN